ncbi:MAG TPA: DNA-processing protein DprA [Dissulfurispiraceae bacterium]|nr:DNA-processing protein DprA [Dissulfurispiraceae bacterium]
MAEDGSLQPAGDLRYWVALTTLNDIGPVTAKRLLAAFGSPRRIFEASPAELTAVETIKASRAKNIADFSAWRDVDRTMEDIRRSGAAVLTYTSEGYPASLRQIEDAPLLLYMRGTVEEHDRYAIAIVGSRAMTDYGQIMAERLARDLASRGITVVSGMARGIDTAAHRGALRAGGRSIAVLGSGVDTPYPPENKRLYEQLSGSGCVISEFPPGTPPFKENFPKRNRLISGLSLGVVVVEAAADSGSLITARCALDQGKEVFAVPGNVTSPWSEGTNPLLKNGAKLVQGVDDILEEIAPLVKAYLRSSSGTSGQGASDPLDKLEISEEEKAICGILGAEPKHVDAIAREAQMAPSRLLPLLLSLEIRGVVRQIEGKRFYRL